MLPSHPSNIEARKPRLMFSVFLALLLAGCDGHHPTQFDSDGKSQPPFGGGAYISPDIITSADPTSMMELRVEGREVREVYDQRVEERITMRAFVYTAVYNDGLTIEMLLNPEINDSDPAVPRLLAEKYATVFGQLPATLRQDIRSVVIHPGNEGFWALYREIYIYLDSAVAQVSAGFLEEVAAHEAAHASLDLPHLGSPGWRAAQAADPTFISDYARDYPEREDLAETIVAWLAVRHRPDQITRQQKEIITAAIPNRLDYLDSIAWDLYPLIPTSRASDSIMNGSSE